MSITVPEPVAQKGKKDARRHRDKQKEAIRKRLPEIISEESIITKRGDGRTVKVPIRSLDIPHLRPGSRKTEDGDGSGAGGIGVGQGPGDPGDVIGRRPGQGKQPGPEAGEEPGTDYIETEIEMEELIAMMLEDLGLPNLEKKEIAELEVILGLKISGISKSGPRILLDPRRSAKIPFGRFFAFLQILQDKTNRDELTCFSALKEVDGNLGEALELLENPDFCGTEEEVEPFGIFIDSDLRYHRITENINHESNAVVIAMMDVSGSMSTMKKYLARSLLFWMVEFLRTIYETVEIRFIIHHTTARLVPEEEFFHTMESGGTMCESAYKLANSLIDSEYPTNLWNVYALHFSDGEDWNPQATMGEAQKFFDKGVNMFGYGEIHVNEYYRANSNLLPAFIENFPIQRSSVPIEGGGGMSVYLGKGDFPFVGLVIESKEHIFPALKEFLKKDRWAQ